MKKTVGKLMRQPTINDVMTTKAPYGRDHPKQKKFDENLKDQMINDCIPFRTADSYFFRKTVGDLDPRIKVKSAMAYSMQIRKQEIKVKNKIKKIVRLNAKALLALTTDMWDDRKQNSYCSLTAHFIGTDFKLVRVTPAIKYFGNARHKSENIAEALREEIESVKAGADVPTVLVSDSTANMVKMRELLKEADIINEELGCANHTAQNAIKDTMKETEGMKVTLTKSKRLVKHFRKSSLATNRLKTACAKTGHKYKKIKTCIEIRWNSEYDCLERMLYHQECIEEMDRNKQLEKVSDSVLSRAEWRLVEAAVDILKPVKITTKILESEMEPTMNRLAECLFEMDEMLKEKIKDVGTPKKSKDFAKNLQKNLKARFPNYGLCDSVVAYANFLDPHLKGIHVEQVGMMTELIEKVKDAGSKVDVDGEVNNVENNNIDSEEEGQTLTATQKLIKKKRNPVSNVFDVDGDANANTKAIEHEIEVYKKLPSCSRKDDVLDWWKVHENILPRLSILARQILAIPAATGSSERLFSISGLFDTVRRGSLNTETLEILTLLKANRKVIEKFGQDIEESEESDTEEDVNESVDSSGGDQDENSSGDTVDGEYSDEEVSDTDED